MSPEKKPLFELNQPQVIYEVPEQPPDMDGEDILWLLIVGGIISLLVVVLISFLAGNTAVNLLESVGLEQGAGPVGAAVSLVAFVWIAAGILKLIFGNL